MFGPDFLAKPITTFQQASAWVWLPLLPAGQTWMNVFTLQNYGQGAINVTVATPVSSFPLFERTYAAVAAA
jgi:alpha-glucosidase (family GH31 glycosyl hydrolase)